MSFAAWCRSIVGCAHRSEKYDHAKKLIGEVTASAKELNESLHDLPHDPFRAIVRDLRTQRSVSEHDKRQAQEIYEKNILR